MKNALKLALVPPGSGHSACVQQPEARLDLSALLESMSKASVFPVLESALQKAMALSLNEIFPGLSAGVSQGTGGSR